MRSVLLSMIVLGGCAADADDPAPSSDVSIDVSLVRGEVAAIDSDEQSNDVCALAEALPADDICSLICDPFEMAARMVSDGNDRGTCYQLYCSLPGGSHVLVGVCLPP